MSKVYISGPISGHDPEQVKERFDMVMANLKEDGLHPVSPLNNGLPEGSNWMDHMRADISMMMKCDSVAFMANWNISRGCRVEHQLAESLGMKIMYLSKNQQLIKKDE